MVMEFFLSSVLKIIYTPVSELSVQIKYMLRINVRTSLKVTFDTTNIYNCRIVLIVNSTYNAGFTSVMGDIHVRAAIQSWNDLS